MFILADIGGTNTRLAVSNDGLSFSQPEKFATEQDFGLAMRIMGKKIGILVGSQTITASIIGLAGVMDWDNGCLASSPNLPNWINKPIEKELKRITGSSTVHIINDAALAGLGEAGYGAGKSYRIVAYLTISTGIGGARIVDQQLESMTYGTEPGWQIIDAGGQLVSEGKCPATLEDLIGGANIEKRFGQKPETIQTEAMWKQMALWLAYGCQNVTAMWSPEVIVLGGSLMNKIKIDLVKQYAKQIISFVPHQPEITPATLGDDRAFYGALAWLKRRRQI